MNYSDITERNGVLGVYYEHKSGSQNGYKSFYKGVYDNCIQCGNRFFALLSQQKRRDGGKYCSNSCSKIGKKLTDLHKEKLSISKRGDRNPFWNGGKMTSHGYRLLKRPDHPNANGGGYVFEHRLVMSEHIGRPLTKEEVVHHKNRNRSDNRIENLELLSKREHSQHHIFSTNKNWVYVRDRDVTCPHCEKSINLQSLIQVSK